MEEKLFDSSYLSKGIYNPETRELIIVFKTTESPKMFFEVPEEVWGEMKLVESSGFFYHTKIKKVYEYSVWGKSEQQS